MNCFGIRDVAEMCQRGDLRAFATDSGVFLEDATTKELVRLDNGAGSADAEKRELPRRSRVERMFGQRETWTNGKDLEEAGPYKGFLMVVCEECGEVRAFCAKRETYGFKCNACGHETPLENLRPMFMHCKCGKSFRYKTNATAETISHSCIDCKAPVDMELNKKGTAYVTIGVRGGRR